MNSIYLYYSSSLNPQAEASDNMFNTGKRKLAASNIEDMDMIIDCGPGPKAPRIEPNDSPCQNLRPLISCLSESINSLSLPESGFSIGEMELDPEYHIWGGVSSHQDSSPPSEYFAFLVSGYQQSSSTEASRELLRKYPSMTWLAKITAVERQIKSQINRNSRPVSMVFYKSDEFAAEELEAIEILYSVKDRFTMVLTTSYKERDICIRRLQERGLYNGYRDLRVQTFHPKDWRRMMADMRVLKGGEDSSNSRQLILASVDFDMEMDEGLMFPQPTTQVAEPQGRGESNRVYGSDVLSQSLNKMSLDQDWDIEM